MSEAIYRKYRPKTFEEVTNQNHVKVTLRNQIASDKVAHAYLFAGPRGVGKTTIARLLAKALNCKERKESEPCGTCDHCVQLDEGRALDVVEIDAASHTGVDNVRENIIDAVRFSPGQGAYKVFIIDEVHMLSTSAFNALLKTLEEPPEHAIFILATTEVHKIPATILSRCQRFDFHRIATQDMIERLQAHCKAEGVKVDDEVLASIARLSEGCLRDGESLLGQILALGEKEITAEQASLILPVTNTATVVDIVEAVSRRDQTQALEIVNGFVDQGGSVRNLVDELIDFVRTMMLVGLEGPYHDHYDKATMERVRNMLNMMPAQNCRTFLDLILSARTRPTHDALPHLPLELAIVEYCMQGAPAQPIPKQDPPTPKQDPPPPAAEPPSEPTPAADPAPAPEVPEPAAEQQSNPEQSTEVKKDASNASFSVEDLKNKWGRCCEEIAKKNIALPLVLQKAVPLAVEDGEVQIGFDKKFHFDTISQPKNCQMLIDAVNVVMNSSVVIKPVFMREEEEKTLDTLVEAFGGSVVE